MPPVIALAPVQPCPAPEQIDNNPELVVVQETVRFAGAVTLEGACEPFTFRVTVGTGAAVTVIALALKAHPVVPVEVYVQLAPVMLADPTATPVTVVPETVA